MSKPTNSIEISTFFYYEYSLLRTESKTISANFCSYVPSCRYIIFVHLITNSDLIVVS